LILIGCEIIEAIYYISHTISQRGRLLGFTLITEVIKHSGNQKVAVKANPLKNQLQPPANWPLSI
jgi:hypothetical protein